MRVILYGASGMVGQGVLRECLADSQVHSVLLVGRRPLGIVHPKVSELVLKDLLDYSSTEGQLAGFDACLFCLGISSVGLGEAEYRETTYDLTMAAAYTFYRNNPGKRFIYISGAGTDSTGSGRVMWARIKGQTENELFSLSSESYALRPGYIQPLKGIRSRSRLTQAFYTVVAPMTRVLTSVFPSLVLTTRDMGLVMLDIARNGAKGRRLEAIEIKSMLRGR